MRRLKHSGIYWCLNCNVPLLDSECEICRVKGEFVPLSRPVDPKPAFSFDLNLLHQTISQEFGVDAANFLLKNVKVAVFNRVPYLDKGYEVLVDGRILGHLFFDFPRLYWRFKPLREGYSRLWVKKLGFWVVVNNGFVIKNQILGELDFVAKNLPEREGGYVFLVSKKDEVLGVGELTDKGKVYVLKVWKPEQPRFLNFKASWNQVVKANFSKLKTDISKACKFIGDISGRLKLPVFVSYSGGKDSLTTLYLTVKASCKTKILFNDTGLELPETLENVDRVASKFGVEILKVKAEEAFWIHLKDFGPPTRENRWCSKVCKLKPTAKFLDEKIGENKILCFVGQRKAESFRRAGSRKIWVNRFLPKIVASSPINDWSMLQVWLCLMMERLDGYVNKLYFEGFDRIGCFMCPSMEMADLLVVKKRYPILWERWEKELENWILNQNLSYQWIDYGLWRWKNPPKRILDKIGG